MRRDSVEPQSSNQLPFLGLFLLLNSHSVRPSLPAGGHAFDAFGILPSQVFGLGPVGSQIVEFPFRWVLGVGDEFPIAFADGAAVFVFEVEFFVSLTFFSLEERQQALSLQQRQLISLVLLRIFRSRAKQGCL